MSASTQNQALSALLCFCGNVIGYEIGYPGEAARARRPKRLPVVMTRYEVRVVLSDLDGVAWLMPPHKVAGQICTGLRNGSGSGRGRFAFAPRQLPGVAQASYPQSDSGSMPNVGRATTIRSPNASG